MGEAVEGILFDKDGTLIDYAASWAPINREAARFAAKGDASLAAYLLEIGGQDRETGRVSAGSLLAASNTAEIATAWVEAGSPFGVEVLTRDLDRIFTAGSKGAVGVPGIADLFDRLRRAGIRLGVATSDSAASAKTTLETIISNPPCTPIQMPKKYAIASELSEGASTNSKPIIDRDTASITRIGTRPMSKPPTSCTTAPVAAMGTKTDAATADDRPLSSKTLNRWKVSPVLSMLIEARPATTNQKDEVRRA